MADYKTTLEEATRRADDSIYHHVKAGVSHRFADRVTCALCNPAIARSIAVSEVIDAARGAYAAMAEYLAKCEAEGCEPWADKAAIDRLGNVLAATTPVA